MVIYLGLFKLTQLNLSILVIYPLKQTVVTKNFGLLVTNLSFSTSGGKNNDNMDMAEYVADADECD